MSGHPEKEMRLWFTKIAEFCDHDAQIQEVKIAADGQTLATLGSDRNLLFYKMFDKITAQGKDSVSKRRLMRTLSRNRDECLEEEGSSAFKMGIR